MTVPRRRRLLAVGRRGAALFGGSVRAESVGRARRWGVGQDGYWRATLRVQQAPAAGTADVPFLADPRRLWLGSKLCWEISPMKGCIR